MQFDTRNSQSTQGFKPNVDNTIHEAKCPFGVKFWIILFWILFPIGTIITTVLYIKTKNEYRRRQSIIVESSSTIQAAQAKRYATLIKMVDVVKGYAKHEKETLEEVTKMRSKLVSLEQEKDPAKYASILESVRAGINIQLEKYPELKADRLYLQLSSEITILEEEIYAAIRVYNQKVRSFNAEIYNFPTIYVADKLKLINFPDFEASEKERADVDMGSLLK